MRVLFRLALPLILTTTASAQCQYSVFAWPQWQCQWEGPKTITGTGLNDLGAWCGYRLACYPEESGLDLKWLPIYCPPNGMPQVLTTPAGASDDGARANAVNNAGVVVGYMSVGQFSEYWHGVIWWPDGSHEVIPPPGGVGNSVATDINSSGVVVGYTSALPYVLQDGVMTTITSPGFDSGYAWRIADSGDVIGTFGNLNTNARGFRWKNGEVSILEPLPGVPVSIANGVNSSGHVCGQSRTTTTPATGKPTIWINDLAAELPMPAGYTTGTALHMNDAGMIAGICGGPGLSNKVVVWFDGVPFLLNSLLVPGSATLGNVVAINEEGEILSGGGPRLATPTSQFSTDLNGDCAVNGADLGVLLSSWGAADFDPRCDFNGDGAVDGFDLGTLLGEWTATK